MPGRAASTGSGGFQEVAKELAAADLAIGNLEGVIIPQDLRSGCLELEGPPPEYRLLLDEGTTQELQRAGFDLLGLANNHVLDCGETGLSAMVGMLHRAGLHTAGVGEGVENAYLPAILHRRGLRIAVLALNSVGLLSGNLGGGVGSGGWQPAAWERDRVEQAIRQARSAADFVIVSIHWGEEYSLRASLWQRSIAQDMFTAGADLVFGHHPHVVQESQVFERPGQPASPGFVAYSLGNFRFDQYQAHASQGLALRLRIDRVGLKSVEGLPLHSTHQPRWMDLDGSREMIERIKPEPRRTGFQCGVEDCQPVAAESSASQGIFRRGAIDLTGDGQAETIWLHDGKISIYHQGDLAWTSPEAWEVVDLALGDPNDDGRYEILAAVNTVREGESASQPFVLGYRGGIYRQLWGGSPVSDPILEVELGDIDADGTDELVVIEERGRAGLALAVWDWHGWGFSLFWRSPAGRYTDLQVQRNPGSQLMINTGIAW